MSVGTLSRPYHVRRGSPCVMMLRFWTDATKTVGRDMTAISGSWLAELRANPTDTSPAATFSIDASGAAGTSGTPGVLLLSLDADTVTAILAGNANPTLGWDLVALDSDTPLVSGRVVIDGAYTHAGGGASPSTSTPLGVYDITMLGATTTSLLEIDLFSGEQGEQGPPGPPVTLDWLRTQLDGVYASLSTDGSTLTQGAQSVALAGAITYRSDGMPIVQVPA